MATPAPPSSQVTALVPANEPQLTVCVPSLPRCFGFAFPDKPLPGLAAVPDNRQHHGDGAAELSQGRYLHGVLHSGEVRREGMGCGPSLQGV